MALNLTSPTVLSGLLLGDSNSGNLKLTQVGGVPVSAILELQSTEGAFIVPRMTTGQRDAMTTLAPGMCIYNITTSAFNFREGIAWRDLTSGSVSGPGISVDRTIAVWNGVTGTVLQDTGIVIDVADNVTEVNTIHLASGTAALPSYTFTGNPDTGMYRIGAGVIGFAAQAAPQFAVHATALAVNYVSVTGSPGDSPGFYATGPSANVEILLQPKGTSGIRINSGSVTPAFIQLSNTANDHVTALRAANVGADVSFTLPAVDTPVITGATAMATALCTDGSGNMTFNTSGICVAKGTFTNVQFRGMYATPIRLLTTPGGGTAAIIVHTFALKLLVGGAANVYTDGGGIQLQYGAVVHGDPTIAATAKIPVATFLSGSPRIGRVTGAIGDTDGLSNLITQNEDIYISNDTDPFVGGTDGTNTWEWQITFSTFYN